MKLRFLGHSSFEIIIDDQHIVVDPFYPNGTPAFDKIDYVLLTHAHQDHVNNAEELLTKYGATVLSIYEVATHFINDEIEGIAMNHGGDIDLPFGNVKLVNAVHSSSFADGKYGGNPCGFLIRREDKSLYVAGDTAVTMDMQLIPMFCDNLAAAILPVGNHFTMGYEDAAIASDLIKCDKIIGCHFDTFPPITIDKEAAKTHFINKNKELILLDIGGTIEL